MRPTSGRRMFVIGQGEDTDQADDELDKAEAPKLKAKKKS